MSSTYSWLKNVTKLFVHNCIRLWQEFYSEKQMASSISFFHLYSKVWDQKFPQFSIYALSIYWQNFASFKTQMVDLCMVQLNHTTEISTFSWAEAEEILVVYFWPSGDLLRKLYSSQLISEYISQSIKNHVCYMNRSKLSIVNK